ncbi:MAG: RnfH family protein [Beggiatoa sp. IS2]|nr:MAG: RnfH family protein [Beggiatoa sp. IS2]
MKITITYADPKEPVLLKVDVPKGCTVGEAIEYSGLSSRFPEVNLSAQKVGIYGKFVKLDAHLKEHDRIEIYQPITVDPKTVKKRKMGSGDDDE